MEKERLRKFVDALRELAETITFMVMIRPESFHWLWVTTLPLFFHSQLPNARNKINMVKYN